MTPFGQHAAEQGAKGAASLNGDNALLPPRGRGSYLILDFGDDALLPPVNTLWQVAQLEVARHISCTLDPQTMM